MKAREFSTSLRHPEFVCSSGWLKQDKTQSGEAASVTEDMTLDWLGTKLPALLGEFQPDEIFNADETGLFWKCLPDEALHIKWEPCSGDKKSKDRITVLVCSNMNGTERLPLVVIGRFAKPSCFKNVRTHPQSSMKPTTKLGWSVNCLPNGSLNWTKNVKRKEGK